jgi:GT2 family glycosyltransferase
MRSVPSPTVSVIVPVHKGGAEFERCVASLTRAAPPPQEIIIVADGESAAGCKPAQTFGLQILRLPVTGGPARARNHGARAATGDILLFIDSDVAVPADIISKVTATFTGDLNLSAAIGSYDDEPGAGNFLSQYKNLLHHYVHQHAAEQGFTFWGACGAIRRDVFLALEGFDESYREPSIEDIELGYRLKQAGHTIRLVKNVQVKHLKRWRVLSLLKTDFFHRALPWTELAWRHRRLPSDLNLRRSSRLSGLLTCGLAAAVVSAAWNSQALFGAAVLALLLLLLNGSLYSFFYRKRGVKFTLGAIPWHWFYLLYSTLAFAIGTLGFMVVRCASAFNLTKASSPVERI